ncbi:protein fluG isoform X2 [Selaginella moellendorffii]|uniref:protein fluG isoform X2 n=1 Tax=Selaginella moellendorffii TaxID=88036 RepID=UPI000D1C7A0B|nr:protein fluG isoform X2 [Selaginella moellendorffii]|eukprot:XP_024524915.1 protein fluG isoform X2 [Selaginella moellendorffii]
MAVERERIRDAIHSTALVDGHAHNLVGMDSHMPLLQAFSESQGEALARFGSQTLCFKRSLRDLSQLYGTDASLESIEAHRQAAGLEALTRECFHAAGISVLLLDDGLAMDKMKALDWHKGFVPVVHRVLRIEIVAEAILKEGPPGGVTWTLDSFADRFVGSLKLLSEGVVAFKSIAAYRSGLDIDPTVSRRDAEQGLVQDMVSSPLRLKNKLLLNFLFVLALEVACSQDLPMQIHSGFGDKDLDLRLSNPLHLRAVLEDERFKKCRLVLLHASYPFVQEASYLASVYAQVYLDFGLAIPKLSIRGMENTLSQLLELAPLDKMMFSTDGYAFPETYYLGTKWTREVLTKVLYNAYVDGDLSVEESIAAAEGILQKNALSFYKLNGDAASSPSTAAIKKMVHGKDKVMAADKEIKQVRLLWGDGSGQRRCRVVPAERFKTSILKHGVGLVECGMALPAGIDAVAKGSGLSAVGEVRLMPDLATKRRLPWYPQHEIVLGNMHIVPGSPWECCPRGTLQCTLEILKKEFNLEIRVGFENEFYLLKPSKQGPLNWTGLDTTNYCSAISFDSSSHIMDDIYDSLKKLDIEVEQMHAEAGNGQFEISLNHCPASTAADNVLLLRDTVKSIALKHHINATFLPKYFANDLGSGSHVHMSLWEGGVNKLMDETSRYGMSPLGEEFLAGVLHHLPSILAFTAPHPNSYARLRPCTWSGAFQCWGHSNREAALRTLSPPDADGVSNFELKAFDGMANPHLGLAAIVAAGIDGLRKHMVLPEGISKFFSCKLKVSLLKLRAPSLFSRRRSFHTSERHSPEPAVRAKRRGGSSQRKQGLEEHPGREASESHMRHTHVRR